MSGFYDKDDFMNNKTSVRTKKSIFVITIVIAVVVVTALCLLIQRYYANLNQQLFNERRDHLVEFTEKSAELISKSNDNAENQLNACAYAVSQADSMPDADLNEWLAYMSGLVNDENILVLLFDEKGNYYSSDGASGYWQESDFLQESGKEVNIGVMACPHESNVTRIFYVRKLDEQIQLPGSNGPITHIAIAINSDEFRNEMSVTAYGETCYTYLTNKDGRRIYQYAYNNNNNNGFLGGYNLINAVEQYEVLHKGKYDSLSEAVEAHETDAYEFTYTDAESGEQSDWFVAVSYIDNAEWIVLLLVPTESIGAGTASLLSGTAAFFMAIAAAMLFIFVVVFVILMRSRSDQRLIAQQEENNKLLKKAADEADAANRAKTEFLSHMSHDIRTPINAIMGMTGIALKNIGKEERVRDCLGKIDGSSQHLLSLVNDVLDMSRIESGKTVMNNEAFNLRECLNNCASIISGQLVNRDIALIRDFDRVKAPAVMGDELHLRQVFINILGNSVKFTPDGGSITFRAWEEGDENGKRMFGFELSDTGIGMSKEYLPKLFEAFSQEDGGSRTTYKGTGLGMAITKSFVDLMGGTVDVESELNKGTKFFLHIPMEVCDMPEEAVITGEDYSALNGLKVILAEDNELNAEIAQEILTEVGITSRLAVNGSEAVEVFSESKPGEYAAILMDIMMPKMNGYEATRAIRRLDRADASEIPIIALSANAYEDDIRKAKEAGMNAHVAKPVNPGMIYKELMHYAARADQSGEISLEGMSVLAAEDNELNAEIMMDILEETGMKVQLVSDGKAALDAFKASEPGQYALILMDMQMPVMDGVTATKQIRALERPDAKNIPILAMTANTIEEAGDAAKDAGMSGFLTKPLQVEEIKKYFSDPKGGKKQ